MELSNRQRVVLREVVESYIRTGEAVASRQVASSSSLKLSSASIRNLLSELEELGFVSRPHSSAGAVPTDPSFRLYVDELCRRRRLPVHLRLDLTARMQALQRELVEDIAWVAQLIADATREAGVAVHPLGEEAFLEAVSIVPLLDNRVLGVVVTSDGMVEKRALTLSGVWDREDLLVLSNYITAVFRKKTLSEIRHELESSLGAGEDSVDSLTEPYRDWAESVVVQLFELPVDAPDVCVAGADRLLETTDFQEADRIRSLVRVLEDRDRIAQELSRDGDCECRTRYIIGRESEMTAGGNLGMVASYFYHQGRRRGAVGVVGPRRMDYGRIVPVVEFIGDTLTKMLEEGGAENV